MMTLCGYIEEQVQGTLKFCKNDGSSAGVRQFIQQDVVQFAKQNPNCVLYLKPRRHRSPVMVAEYLNGETHWMLQLSCCTWCYYCSKTT